MFKLRAGIILNKPFKGGLAIAHPTIKFTRGTGPKSLLSKNDARCEFKLISCTNVSKYAYLKKQKTQSPDFLKKAGI